MARTLKKTEARIPCRISFAKVLDVDKNGFYSCSLLIPKSDTKTLAAIDKAVDAAIEDGKFKLGNKEGKVNKKMLKLPLRDADDEEITYDGYKGMMYFNAKNKYRPQIVDSRLQPIIDEDDIYSGCHCKIIINFYAFSRDGNKGIAASLGNIQKIRDDKRFGGGRSNAEDDFDAEDTDDEISFY